MTITTLWVFGNLNGPVPASYLDDNFNFILDNASLSQGGTIYGPLVQNLTNAGTGNVSIVPYSINFSPTEDRGLTGYQGLSAIDVFGTVYQNPDLSGARFSCEFNQTNLTIATTQGYVSEGGTLVATGGFSALTSHMSVEMPMTATGQMVSLGTNTLPPTWAFYGTANDVTGLNTSVSGAKLAGFELDMQCSGLDGLGFRGGFTLNSDNKTGQNGVTYSTMKQAFYASGLNNSWIDIAYRVAGNVLNGLDTRPLSTTSTSTTITATATTGATLISVANVIPFTFSNNFLGAPTSPSNPIYNVSIGTSGSYYEVIGYNVDSNTALTGELTITPGLAAGDGTSGNTVSRPFFGVFLRTGDWIGFDYQGNTRMGFMGGQIQLVGALNVQQGLGCLSFTVYNSAVFHSGASFTGGVINWPSYTYANLPAPTFATTTGVVWCSNGCKPGETTGNGTGVLVMPNHAQSAWCLLNTTTVVTS